ncbi:glycine-rich domain-containing protein [Pseudomonas sp. MWU13-3659]|uniref:glycine-rich domain-containing protein n=1 Tax=Pseudomonas sp. MWU13-3659 TaxID=2986964 RepID=UPI00207612D8|nr:hypothetical protein [Pseudomonas sp. MWU13-3659]
MSQASLHSQLDMVLLRSLTMQADAIVASTSLSAERLGHVVIDASAGNLTVTLPAADKPLGAVEVILRRRDTSANTLSIKATGNDRIMLDTLISNEGLASTELIFAGDFLALRADGAGKWWCVGQAQLPASLATGYIVWQTPGTSDPVVPPVLRSGRKLARVRVTAGGGGGARSTVAPGPGGGGGGGVSEKLVSLAGLSTVNIAVGAGGAGAAIDGQPGQPGGSSSFVTFCSASGGLGGTNDGNSSYSGGGYGGDLNTSMGDGGVPMSIPNGALFGGHGGGAVSIAAAVDSSRPRKPGCGGGGRFGPGAPGAHGCIELWW